MFDKCKYVHKGKDQKEKLQVTKTFVIHQVQ